MNVVTAFLYGSIEEEVYVEPPYGTRLNDKDDKVCLLNKALYGLKQALRVWYKTLTQFLTSLGFTRSNYDFGLFYNKAEQTYITIYVDDLKIVGANDSVIFKIKEQLSNRFKMKDLRPATHYLGMKII